MFQSVQGMGERAVRKGPAGKNKQHWSSEQQCQEPKKHQVYSQRVQAMKRTNQPVLFANINIF